MSASNSDNDRFGFETVARIGASGGGEAVFYRRTTLREEPVGLIGKRDIAELAIQGIMAAAATMRPAAALPAFCHRTSRLARPPGGRTRLGPFGDALRAVLGDLSDPDVEQCFDRWWEGLHRRRMMLIREYIGKGPVRFTVTGREHLDAAAAQGRGAILWASQFTAQTLAGKRGLFEAGYQAHQVSSRHHGFRGTRFGNKFLNQPLVRAENRYLAGRLSFEREEAGMLIRRVKRLFGAGAFAIFTNNLFAGRSFVQMPLGAAGFVSMPTTPISLALRGRVPLLYISTLERDPLAHYEIRISADLAAADEGMGQARVQTRAQGGAAKQDFNVIAPIALKARDELLADMRAAPDQYLNWLPHAASVIPTRRSATAP